MRQEDEEEDIRKFKIKLKEFTCTNYITHFRNLKFYFPEHLRLNYIKHCVNKTIILPSMVEKYGLLLYKKNIQLF